MGAALPGGPAGRWLALGIALIALALLWLGMAAPLLDWHAARAERLEQRAMLARRMTSLARDLPALRAAASGRPAEGPTGGALLEGATDAVAAASLQQRVQDMAAQAGASLSSVETLPASQIGSNGASANGASAYRRIGVHVALNASWTVLIGLLRQIEAASPRMLVDDLQVHAGHSVTPPPDPPLDAGFTVFAFRAASSPRGATP
jgi:general secretion pathway protein M